MSRFDLGVEGALGFDHHQWPFFAEPVAAGFFDRLETDFREAVLVELLLESGIDLTTPGSQTSPSETGDHLLLELLLFLLALFLPFGQFLRRIYLHLSVLSR
jgi:hypothetical protein